MQAVHSSFSSLHWTQYSIPQAVYVEREGGGRERGRRGGGDVFIFPTGKDSDHIMHHCMPSSM